MNGICQFSITFFDSIIVLPFINLVFIKVETIFSKPIMLGMPHIYILHLQLISVFRVEFNLFPLEVTRFSSSKEKLVFRPVVQQKFIRRQLKTVLIVLDHQTREYFSILDIWNFFIMKLKKVCERFSQEKTGKGDIRYLCGN